MLNGKICNHWIFNIRMYRSNYLFTPDTRKKNDNVELIWLVHFIH